MSTLSFKPPLQHVCLLRLSAIGDTCHALAALRAFQAAWPETRFTWVIGKVEARLMTAIVPEIEFITFDKGATLRELLAPALAAARTAVRSAARHAIVVSREPDQPPGRLLPSNSGSIGSAPASCNGCSPTRRLSRGPRSMCWTHSWASLVPAASKPQPPHWDICLPPSSLDYARSIITAGKPTLLISPCSSHAARNWSAARYAAVADHAASVHRHESRAGGRPQLRGGADGRGDCRRGTYPHSSIRSARTRCRNCWA